MLGELRILLRLGLPAVLGQLGSMLLHAVDTLMLGRYGVHELGAAALGSQWIFLFMTIGMGFVMGIDPLVAQRHGRGDGPGTGRALQHGLILAGFATVFIALAWCFTGPALHVFGQTAELSRLAHRYAVIQIPSIFPFLAFCALRSYLQGREIVAPAMWIMLPVNLLNVGFNWLFIFGPGPFPEWGLDGAALATCLSRSLMGLFLLIWVLRARLCEGAWESLDFRARFRVTELREPFLLGLPIALHMGFEILAFVIAALVAGTLGATALAAHSIVLSFAALLFMIPLGVSAGVTTRIGNLLGGDRRSQIGVAVRATTAITLAVIAFNVATLGFGRIFIAAVYTTDALVRATASSAFLVAAAFQASDCAQVVVGGALRGMGRTRSPAVAAFFGYYVFGIPVGYYLGVVRDWGLPGLWWGLALGLTIVAITIVAWFILVLREEKIAFALPVRAARIG